MVPDLHACKAATEHEVVLVPAPQELGVRRLRKQLAQHQPAQQPDCFWQASYRGGCAPASAFSSAAAQLRTAALISFIATRTLPSGWMSVTRVWIICGQCMRALRHNLRRIRDCGISTRHYCLLIHPQPSLPTQRECQGANKYAGTSVSTGDAT